MFFKANFLMVCNDVGMKSFKRVEIQMMGQVIFDQWAFRAMRFKAILTF